MTLPTDEDLQTAAEASGRARQVRPQSWYEDRIRELAKGGTAKEWLEIADLLPDIEADGYNVQTVITNASTGLSKDERAGVDAASERFTRLNLGQQAVEQQGDRPRMTTPVDEDAVAAAAADARVGVPAGFAVPARHGQAGRNPEIEQIADQFGIPYDAAEEMFTLMGGEDEDPLVGVPSGFTAQVDRRDPDALDSWDRRRVTENVEPRYRQSDIWGPSGLDPSGILRLQEQLVASGRLDAGGFQPGYWDTETRTAYAEVLGLANLRGQHVASTLSHLSFQTSQERKREVEELRSKTFEAEDFLPPDPDTARQRARSLLSQMGRRAGEMSEAELAQMESVLTGEFRKQHDVEQEVARRRFATEQENLIAEVAGRDPAARTDLSGLQTHDPTASFDEWFQQHYAGEISTRDTSAKVAQQGAAFDAGVQGMRGQVARGGM